MKFTFKHPFLFALLVLPVCLLSCKKDKPGIPPIVTQEDHLAIKVQPVFGSMTLYLDTTYTTNDGLDIQFTDLKFFAGNWKNGDQTLTDASLFDYRESGTSFIAVSKSPDDFQAIQGYLGIGPAVNHTDPTAYPNDSPLNITNAGGMHWGWNPGYIFMKVEAKVDTIPDGIPLFDHNVVIHVGTDAFLQTLSFPSVTWATVSAHNYQANMQLDMATFLTNGAQAINLKTEYISHSAPGQEALSAKAIQNFAAALTFIP